MKPLHCLLAALLCVLTLNTWAEKPEGDGWTSLFNGKDFTHWKNPSDAIWTIQDGVMDCAPRIDIEGEKSLWSEQEYGDIELYVEWRIKETKGEYGMPTILPDGTEKKDADGNFIVQNLPNADSGIYLRGDSKNQINIWCWPVGSGEVYGYRTDKTQPTEVRAGVTPKLNADNPVGEWNSFHITMKGDRLTVALNGKTVIDNAQLPGIAPKGPIALQHHGGYDPRRDHWSEASSLVQFREIWVREINNDTAKFRIQNSLGEFEHAPEHKLFSIDPDSSFISSNLTPYVPEPDELRLRGWDSPEMKKNLGYDEEVVYFRN